MSIMDEVMIAHDCIEGQEDTLSCIPSENFWSQIYFRKGDNFFRRFSLVIKKIVTVGNATAVSPKWKRNKLVKMCLIARYRRKKFEAFLSGPGGNCSTLENDSGHTEHSFWCMFFCSSIFAISILEVFVARAITFSTATRTQICLRALHHYKSTNETFLSINLPFWALYPFLSPDFSIWNICVAQYGAIFCNFPHF